MDDLTSLLPERLTDGLADEPLEPRRLLDEARQQPWRWRLPDAERRRFALAAEYAGDARIAASYRLALALDAEARRGETGR